MNGQLPPGDAPGAADLEKLIGACAARLRPPSQWTAFSGYPQSLALAVIDAIWSTGTRYPITRGVIGRYRRRREWEGGDATQDSLTDLLSLYELLGGVDQFIDQIGTRNRISTQPNAIRKGDAVHQAATLLVELGIDTAAQFLAVDGTELGERARTAWLTVPGQGSGISWRYLRMLLGLPDVKPDRMVTRFVLSALGAEENTIGHDAVVRLVRGAAEHFGVEQRALDHEIWEFQSEYRQDHEPASGAEHLRTLAHSFIGAALPALAEVRVVPTSVYNPFVHVGRDYQGSDVMRLPEFTELESALERLYPHRFAGPGTASIHHPEFANLYVFSFLEAVIARCAGDRDGFEADTEPVDRSIDELIAVLDATADELHCCRAVSHLTSPDGEPVRIGEITIYPETGIGSLFERTRRLIPGAQGEEPPRIYDPPHCLVVTTQTGSWDDAYAARRQVSDTIDRFLLLARLLYAGTHQACWQVVGTPTLVTRARPKQRTFGKIGMRNRTQRVVRLSAEDAPAFAALGAYLDAAEVKRDGMAATAFDVAKYRFDRAHEASDDYESVVDLATAFEALLISDGKETDAISMRLKNRAAALLATDTDPGRAIFNDVGKLYDLRSRLVHGGSLTEKDLRKTIMSVTTVPADAPFGIALAIAVDRMRDLVRRSFLARLCLASGPDALWPFGKDTPVDTAIADDRERSTWRRRWRDQLATLGASAAAEAARSGDDPLAIDESGSQ